VIVGPDGRVKVLAFGNGHSPAGDWTDDDEFLRVVT
jgi:hypothetical protein